MKKVPGVAQVRVSLKDGLTILDLKPGNSTTLTELRQIIRNNGFVPKEAIVSALGSSLDDTTFVVSGTNERLVLSAPAQQRGDRWQFAVKASEKQR
jgi:hypothetical protein